MVRDCQIGFQKQDLIVCWLFTQTTKTNSNYKGTNRMKVKVRKICYTNTNQKKAEY